MSAVIVDVGTPVNVTSYSHIVGRIVGRVVVDLRVLACLDNEYFYLLTCADSGRPEDV
jgi:hypothetical protein